MKKYDSRYQHSDFVNGSGYADPTAKIAIARAERPVVMKLAYTAPGYKALSNQTTIVTTLKGGKRRV